ncbi:MAG TPA: LysM peptidoglycan-binding domain-containing protein [Rhodothermales bacterium]|nr:LysM peptidoglycan-binding domain-containing protein [Rhodothermales bacterium]
MHQRRYATLAVLLLLCSGPVAGCRQGSGDTLQQQSEAQASDSAQAADGKVLSIDSDDPRSVAQRLQDVSIAANIQLKLADLTGIDISKIDLQVDNGRVTLQGDVPSVDVRTRAERVAKEVDGVRQLVNQLNAPHAPAQPSPPPSTTPEVEQPTPQQASPAQQPAKPKPEPEKPAATYYTVRSGDNLWTIARRNNTTVDQLKKLNDMSGSKLRPGQKLRVK